MLIYILIYIYIYVRNILFYYIFYSNAIIEDIELRSYGAVFSTYKTKEAKVDIKDVKLTNIQRKGEKHGALLTWQESDSIINIDGYFINI